MSPEAVRNVLEAALLAADGPLPVERLQQLFAGEEAVGRKEIRAALEALAGDYEGRGIELKEVASGFRVQVREQVAPWVNRLWEERAPRYSRALLETLAIIAYRQPITRGEIEDIRGVSVSSSIMKTLQEREWIRVAGHRDVPGRPAVYITTKAFLDYFNLDSLSALPSLAELRDFEEINPDLFADELPPVTTIEPPAGAAAGREAAPGAANAGREATGGEATGGDATGGEATGGDATGGDATGGDATGGEATGGEATGGDATGGDATGGDATGGEATGGDATGGEATGGEATGGEATGGEATGGEATGGEATGGDATGGEATGGAAAQAAHAEGAPPAPEAPAGEAPAAGAGADHETGIETGTQPPREAHG